MHNPSHPGEFIREVYLNEFGISIRKVAENLDVSPSTFTRLLKGESIILPERALRFSKALGRSAESWHTMIDSFNLWKARKKVDLRSVKKIDIETA